MSLNTQQQTTTGWIVFVAAIGMMLGLISVDVATLHNWNETVTPTFVGTTIGHIAATIAAFIGGKLIPSEVRDPHQRTRSGEANGSSTGTGDGTIKP